MNKKQSIISTVVQALVFLNTALMALGVTAFENVTSEMLYAAVSLIATVIAWAYGCWKNHNFTVSANTAQVILQELKEGVGKVMDTIEEPEDAEVK